MRAFFILLFYFKGVNEQGVGDVLRGRGVGPFSFNGV